MRLLALVFCLLAATACDEKSPTGPSAPLNQEFTLSPREAATIDGTGVRVQFMSVSGDSRCPGDAICIQGGDALVHVRVFESGRSTDYELHTGDSSKASITHDTLRVTLVQLQPYPFASLPPIGADDYRATLTVTRP